MYFSGVWSPHSKHDWWVEKKKSEGSVPEAKSGKIYALAGNKDKKYRKKNIKLAFLLNYPGCKRRENETAHFNMRSVDVACCVPKQPKHNVTVWIKTVNDRKRSL